MNDIQPRLPRTKSRTEFLVERIRDLMPKSPDPVQCPACRRECEADRERCPTCRAPLHLRAAM